VRFGMEAHGKFFDFLEVIRRAESGEMVKEADFDKKLGKKTLVLMKQYEIRYDPGSVIPTDDGMADRVYQAAVDLFLELGVYCTDTQRAIRFTREELQWALENASREVRYGREKETVSVYPRKIEDRRDPICFFSAVGTPVTEEMFLPVARSYAQEPLADTFSGPLITSYKGIPVTSGSPIEVEAAIWNTKMLREAAKQAGRPHLGIHNFQSTGEKTDATIASAQEKFGAFPGDGLLVAAIAEMKVDFERLKKVAFLRQSPYVLGALYGPLMGGYAGGPEGTAIALVAHHFLGLLAFSGERHNSFPIHIHHVCNTTRDMLWLISMVGQALARNTRLIIASNAFMASGPCTDMVMDELCAHSITSTVSGWHLNPSAVAKNRYPMRSSGMEPRVHAEVGHRVAQMGLTRREANRIVLKLVEGYEKRIPEAPIGKMFNECYQMDKIRPTDEYESLFAKKKKEWKELGFEVI
jgi:methylamine--corrinoid protein Co-methyltransferase